MRILIFFLVLILGLSAQAVTSGQFFGRYGIIRVMPSNFTGASDSDGRILYEAMNVPQKDSFLGPGKSIEGTDRALQFICANRTKSGFECSIFVHNNGNGSLSFANKTMRYRVTGAEAEAYAKLFKVDASGEYHFVSTDGALSVDVMSQYFEVYFKQPAHIQLAEQGLVIVNVEDTLKVSHSQDFWDSLNYNNDTKKGFMGMSEALNMLANHNPGFRFVYLTRGTELVAGKAEIEFVLNNNFPRGQFRSLNKGYQDIETRTAGLRKMITQNSYSKVILLSHDGAKDSDIFNTLSSENKSGQIYPYIHVVYSPASDFKFGSLLSQPTGYVTAVELMMDWQQKGLVGVDEALKFGAGMVDRILAEKPEMKNLTEYAIPTFVSCSDFQWTWGADGALQFLAPLREHLANRCQPTATFGAGPAANEN